MKNNSRQHDLQLTNGALIDFKVGRDENGDMVISSICIGFEKSSIPAGGLGSAILREIRTTDLLARWHQETSIPIFTPSQERKLWSLIESKWPSGGRQGAPTLNYAILSYFYSKYCEMYPKNPTSRMSHDLETSIKTLQTRLAQARKMNLLTSARSTSGRPQGQVTTESINLLKKWIA